MPHSARKNIIVSHGGIHGNRSRTYRVGQPIPADDVALIPDEHLGADTTGPVRVEKPEKVSAQDRAALAAKADKPQEPTPTPKDKPKAARTAPKGPPAPTEEAPAKAEDPASMPDERLLDPARPTSKRQVTVLRKAEVEALAERLDVLVEEGTKGRTQRLREGIISKLKL